MNGFLLTRDLRVLSIPILSILLLSLQWVLKKTEANFLSYIGYRNFINDLIKHASLQILDLVCPNYLPHALLLLKNIGLDTMVLFTKGTELTICGQLIFVALWFILRGDLLYVLPCVILSLCFSVLFVLRLPRLGNRES